MELCGEVVKHPKFGVGKIVDSIDAYVTVLFEESNLEKRFAYPSAFGSFLELENPVFTSQIEAMKMEIAQKAAAEKKITDELAKFSNPLKCNFSNTKRPKKSYSNESGL